MSIVRLPLRVVAGPSGSVVQPSDFTYLGKYTLDLTFGAAVQGLTHRYVSGDLRLMTITGNTGVSEVSLAGKSYGDSITATTNGWDLSSQMGFMGPFGDYFSCLWYEDPSSTSSRLWTNWCVSYTNNQQAVGIQTRTLNLDGTTSNFHGALNDGVGLQGIGGKKVYGGFAKVPTAFQTQYSVSPYVCGWGGYTSLVGSYASLGPCVYFIPDVAGYSSGTQIPDTDFQIAMDCESGTVTETDWYANGGISPQTFDRGVRTTNPINFFSNSDNRWVFTGQQTVVFDAATKTMTCAGYDFLNTFNPFVVGRALGVNTVDGAHPVTNTGNYTITNVTTHVVTVAESLIDETSTYVQMITNTPIPFFFSPVRTFNGQEIAGTANWLSPCPVDGRGRQTWGDSYYGTGVWIDGATKQGWIQILSGGMQSVWYEGSTLHYIDNAFELHIWDVNDLGLAAQGSLPPWGCYPDSMTDLTSTLNYADPNVYPGSSGYLHAMGATFDATTKKLYLMGSHGAGGTGASARPAIWVFSVNC